MSGHSKWATIKHKKGAADAKRGKLFSRIIKEIQVAARMGGGDVDGNPRLRKVVSDAKGSQMPGDTIERAIKRGTGELEGVNYEEVTYEGTGPGGTLWMVPALTDNRNRTVAELRKVFERSMGNLGGGGSAAWAFDRKGITIVAKDAVDEEKLMELTMDVGAEDFTVDGDNWEITCDVSDLYAVSSALEGADLKVESSEPGFVPKTKKQIEGKDAERCLNLFEALDDHDDSQAVFADFDVSDEELARIMGDA
jgi:YebC/PmpR family DNA-binding regulatory protein